MKLIFSPARGLGRAAGWLIVGLMLAACGPGIPLTADPALGRTAAGATTTSADAGRSRPGEPPAGGGDARAPVPAGDDPGGVRPPAGTPLPSGTTLTQATLTAATPMDPAPAPDHRGGRVAEARPTEATLTQATPTDPAAGWVEPAVTAPAPDVFTDERADPVRFAVIGDYGTVGQPTQDVADLVTGWQPDVIITVGDNNYPSGSAATIDDHIGRYYSAFIAPYTGRFGPGSDDNRFFPTIGNHDWQTRSAAPYLAYFDLPGNERYYAIERSNVRIYALNSMPGEPDGVEVTSRQAAWLRSELAASTACWNLAFFHHPPFSSGPHGPSRWMQWPFAEWGLDAVFAGHDHLYERLTRDGIPYFVNGLGGYSIYQFQRPVPGSRVRFNADYGAQLVEVDGGSLVAQFITRGGEVIDRIELSKAC